MDAVKTAPFDLGSGDDACLVIHGFTGSPWDVRPLGEALSQEKGLFVRGIRLPGHGSTPEAMDPITYRDWEQATEEALLSLKDHRRIYVVGFSMGALLSLMLAAKHPDRVHGLVLLAPAAKLQGAAGWLKPLHHAPLLDALKPYVEKKDTDLDDAEQRALAPMLAAFPVVRLRDLWTIQDRAQRILSRVECPTLVAMARHDHVVKLQGGRDIVRGLVRSPDVRFVVLENGFHILPRDKDRFVLEAEVRRFIQSLRSVTST